MPFVTDPGGETFVAGDPPHGVCVAFNDSALAQNPVWTRLDDPAGYRLASSWQISRGRQTALDKTGTGTAQVTFTDLHGLLDPTNPTGPFFDKLEPSLQAAIGFMNPMTGDWTTLFRGHLSSQNHDLNMITDSRGVDVVVMDLVDAFDLLGAIELAPANHGITPTVWSHFADVYYPGTPSNFVGEPAVWKHVDDHIVQLLDDAKWPNTGQKRAGLRNIFAGNVSVQGTVYARRDSMLTALFDAADAEFPGVANIYVSKTGVLTFHGRFARFYPARPGYGIGSWSCGDMTQAAYDPDCAPISGISFHRSKEDIVNACIALPDGFSDTDVPTQLSKNTTSINKYGWRSLTFEGLKIHQGHDDLGNSTNALVETKKFADYYVQNFAEPQTRVTQIRFRPRGYNQVGASALWALMCGVEIGDLIHLTTSHTGSGSGFNEDFFVEGIHYTAQPGNAGMHDVTMELDVSPQSFFASNPFGSWNDS